MCLNRPQVPPILGEIVELLTQDLQPLLWLVIMYVGASVGSFLNVVVYRLPNRISLIRPGSHCPVCKTPLGPTENVPILGWIWLRGRCKHCGTGISWRYPAIETLTMILFVLSFAFLGFTPQAVLACLLISWLIPLALIDLDSFLLLEELTRSGLILGIVMRLLVPWLSGEGSWVASAESLLGGIVGAVIGIWTLELIGIVAQFVLRKEAMGLGDGKLLAMIGMWLGWQGMVITLLAGTLVGLVGSLIGLALQKVQMGRAIPFGPYLSIGGVIAVWMGPQLIDWYLGLAGW